MSRWKFVKFPISLLKRQVNSSSNFASLFSVMKDDSLLLIYLNQYTLFSKGAHWSKNFSDFQVLESKMVKFLMSILKQQVNSPPNVASLFYDIKDNFSVPFLAQTIYNLLKRSSLTWTFLRLSSVRVKICQIPDVNFQTTSQFLFKLCIILYSHDT